VTGREMFIRRSHLTGTRVRGACWHRPNGPDSSLHNKRRHPVVQVSLEDACAFASWTGKRIPTEKEWEAAARTARGNTYPWGKEWAHGSCNVERSYFGDTTPVDMYIKFVNDLWCGRRPRKCAGVDTRPVGDGKRGREKWDETRGEKRELDIRESHSPREPSSDGQRNVIQCPRFQMRCHLIPRQ
jgi:formylglycine-generating enzyme required for sulfatase activity